MTMPNDAPVQVNTDIPSQTPPIPDVGELPTTGYPAKSVAPLTPQPAATAAPLRLSRGGLTDAILRGVGTGLKNAAQATKQRLSNLAQNSPYAQTLKDESLARQQKQQEMATQKQAALDTHQEAQLRINKAFMDNAFTAQQNAHIESLWPTQDASTRETLINQLQTRDAADRDLLSTLDEAGVHIDTSHFTEGGPFNQLTDDHATSIAKGQQWGLSNGKTGPDADIAFISNAELANTVLPHDAKVITDWNLDPKTGTITPVYSTLEGGKNTALDVVIAHDAAMKKFNQKQDMYTKQVEAQQKAAQSRLQNAQASLAEAEAKNANLLGSFGAAPPQGYTPPSDLFTQSQNQIRQSLTSMKVPIPSNFPTLYGIAHYQIDPATLPNRPYNRPGEPLQMGKDTGIAFIRTYINPAYNDATYPAVKKMKEEFASTRNGTAGGNLIAFNTATGHLGQLYNAATALHNGDVVKLNQIAQTLNIETGRPAPVIYNAIRTALIGELGKTFKGAAPDVPESDQILSTLNNAQSPDQEKDLAKTYAHLMLTKAGAQVAHYYAWTGELPPQTIDPNAARIYQEMGININDVLPEGATIPQGTVQNATAGQQPLTNLYVNPQTGETIGWDGEQYVDAKTRQPYQPKGK